MVFALPSRISAHSFIESPIAASISSSVTPSGTLLRFCRYKARRTGYRTASAYTDRLATLVSRAAIQGGMEADEAFSLSDAFIQRSERFNNLQQITNLQYNMVLDFADRMSSIRQGEKPTQLTISVSNYVRRHFSEKICVEDIARELFYEPSVSFS